MAPALVPCPPIPALPLRAFFNKLYTLCFSNTQAYPPNASLTPPAVFKGMLGSTFL